MGVADATIMTTGLRGCPRFRDFPPIRRPGGVQVAVSRVTSVPWTTSSPVRPPTDGDGPGSRRSGGPPGWVGEVLSGIEEGRLVERDFWGHPFGN